MRILQLAPLWERIPPPAYGGIETVVSLLTEGLVRAGHEVQLWASGDSQTTAELRSAYPHSLRAAGAEDPSPYTWVHAARALEASRDFDVVHNHAGELAMALARLTPTPMLTTIHNAITPDHQIVWDNYVGHYNTVSFAAKQSLPDRSFAGVIYNAVDVSSFDYCEDKDDYLLFLSRMSPQKGPDLAIEAARRLGRRLIMAGKIDPYWDGDYFQRVVQPHIDGRLVEFVGEADFRLKRALYARASCLLVPIVWPEPFGLVMVEAMASGTPVIAFNAGAAPEIVVDGETGYVVEDVDGMVEAVRRLDSISPRRCRQHAEQRFGVSRMVDDYLRMYEGICATQSRS